MGSQVMSLRAHNRPLLQMHRPCACLGALDLILVTPPKMPLEARLEPAPLPW